ncbi:hypothetical protein CORC01_05226 [Colletotrichum orchidophilum]|uniref:Uncharacterized protein n=1 Tax=Colletotrichum orchidophilum TaxID=1209926 RepID=A0A1G4BDK9_9PEZI|nr:uncharacterized protein CORC01_05226 [Colletotrichum orchidophilum]OHE99426.1 hypothetical protein CORC01_05226 [Colletotrichum orchidophilum]
MATSQLESILRRDDRFLKEIWTWFGVGALVILLRFFVRIRMVGPRSLRGDDYAMLVTLFLYTVCFVMVDLIDMARMWTSQLLRLALYPTKKWHDLYWAPSSSK